MIDRTNSLRVAAATALLAVLVVAGCATTTLQSTWSDPAFTGGPFKKLFVMGLSARNVTARRVFEDIMVSKLQAAGVEAVPAYQFLNEDGPAGEQSLQAAVAQSGADAVMMERLLGVDTRTNYSTMMVPGPALGPGMGWYGPYSGWYAVPQVSQYQIAMAETTLYDAKSRQLVWTATSQTFNPTSVQQEAPGLADAVIGGLRQRGLIAGK
jgi:hypothetical protein